jgi:hypothetical protein
VLTLASVDALMTRLADRQADGQFCAHVIGCPGVSRESYSGVTDVEAFAFRPKMVRLNPTRSCLAESAALIFETINQTLADDGVGCRKIPQMMMAHEETSR